jgi:hypothetical protein
MLAFPVVVLLHELAHLLFYRAFGFTGVVLHYSSASSPQVKEYWQYVRSGNAAAASAMHPLWQGAIADAAGPLVSVGLVLICCFLVARYGPHPLLVAAAILSPIRFLVGINYFYHNLLRKTGGPAFDELNIARSTGIPVSLLLIVGLVVLFGGAYWIFRHIRSGERLLSAAALLVGAVVGGFLYFQVIGPKLLP